MKDNQLLWELIIGGNQKLSNVAWFLWLRTRRPFQDGGRTDVSGTVICVLRVHFYVLNPCARLVLNRFFWINF